MTIEPTTIQEAEALAERLVRLRKLMIRCKSSEGRNKLAEAYIRGLDHMLNYKRKRNANGFGT